MRLDVAAFEYPAAFEPSRHDIAGGLGGMPAKGGLIDVPDRPGLGVSLIPAEAERIPASRAIRRGSSPAWRIGRPSASSRAGRAWVEAKVLIDPGTFMPRRQRTHPSTKRSRAARPSDAASACLRQSAIFAIRPSIFSIRLSV
jgi:hypothetical protein